MNRLFLMIVLLTVSLTVFVCAQESTDADSQAQTIDNNVETVTQVQSSRKDANEKFKQLSDGDYHIRIESGELILLEDIADMDTDTSEQTKVDASGAREPGEAMQVNIPDGQYSIELNMAGGSGKASIVSPTLLNVVDGKAFAHIQWSSPNYDYMIVAGEKLLNQSEEGMNSTYDIPVLCMDDEMPVIADTLAMGTPHEVNYTLTFFSESVGSKSALPQEAAKRVILIALFIIIGGGILNHYVNKRSYQ